VNEIIKIHGGSVGVTSEPGKGSTFWFTLPQAAGSEVLQVMSLRKTMIENRADSFFGWSADRSVESSRSIWDTVPGWVRPTRCCWKPSVSKRTASRSFAGWSRPWAAGTECFLQGLEVIPRRRLVYRGIEIHEMDLDAIIARRPSVVLVDELAHTNVPGSRNAKRYQDVEEILAAGIHVMSTLNIQHLESLYNTVEQVTGVKVRERIPDRVVAEADQIVNVDITAEDLRRRLEEGKVYTTERIETALTHFFKPSNIEQLRELTLRELAAQIDSRRRAPLAMKSRPAPTR